MQQIGIGITTKDRRETAEKTIAKIRKFALKGSKIVVVDDASEVPYPDADFRFNEQAGIAKAKNKCFELLDGCEHIFLFDDDCHPIKKGWEKPYINSGQNHLMYIFGSFSNGKPNGNRKSFEKDGIAVYENPCGCMIYYSKKCIDAVGGMDESYGIWGFEHPDHSVRIHNAGLTPYKFMDVVGSDEYFFSYDKEQAVKRSVDPKVRAKHIALNKPKFDRLGKSAKFIPYKPQKNVILTSFFTGVVDTQRGENWKPDFDLLLPLIKSCKSLGIKLVVLHDCFDTCNDENVEFVKVRSQINPYFERWVQYKRYLSVNKFDNVFMVDATDVKVLRNPFFALEKGKIYAGWEKEVIGCKWIYNHHKSDLIKPFIDANKDKQLYNAGVIGGEYAMVTDFINLMVSLGCPDEDMTDMPAFNMALYTMFNDRLVSGSQVTTQFKTYRDNGLAWFMHK